MTASELERLLQQELGKVDLWDSVDQHKSQFLEFPDGLFAEIVFVDGSRLPQGERVLQEVKWVLREKGVELDAIVRAAWSVQSIGDPGPARGLSGGIRAAWAFPVTLVSGQATTPVEVDVTYLAVLEIRNKLLGGSEGSQDEKGVMKEVVREFLKLELSLGGESYWDPIRYPQRELNEAALSYLLLHGAVGKK